MCLCGDSRKKSVRVSSEYCKRLGANLLRLLGNMDSNRYFVRNSGLFYGIGFRTEYETRMHKSKSDVEH